MLIMSVTRRVQLLWENRKHVDLSEFEALVRQYEENYQQALRGSKPSMLTGQEGKIFAQFLRVAESLSPKKQRELGRMAINILSDGFLCAQMLGEDEVEIASILLKGELHIRREPKKWTPEIVSEAKQLFATRHQRLRAAKKDYNSHKSKNAWRKHVALDDNNRPGQPKLPEEIIDELPFQMPAEIAATWTANDLNKKFPELNATASYLKRYILSSKAATKAEGNGHITVGALRF